jgi:4'-phosphopantetheinyl transferase EntD
MIADLATRAIVPSRDSEVLNECARGARRTISLFARRGYYLTRTFRNERDVVVSGALRRVHFVSPAVVAQTIARHSLPGILTRTERATLDGFTVETRRHDWLAGRIAAKRALRGAMRECRQPVAPYTAIEIWNEKNGAPQFTLASQFRIHEAHQPPATFNISIGHADGAAVAGVADTNTAGFIGVDIEPTIQLTSALLERVLQPTELTRLNTAGDHPAPLALWTAKEAVLKATHSVTAALRDVELSWRGPRYIEARVMTGGVRAASVRVRHRQVAQYTIAVAVWQ